MILNRPKYVPSGTKQAPCDTKQATGCTKQIPIVTKAPIGNKKAFGGTK